MIIFIDTNIYLNYYKMKHGVDTLKKMEKYLNGNKKVQLLLPEQIKDEFHRNKSRLIGSALDKLNKLMLGFNFSYAPKEIAELAKKVSNDIKVLEGKIKKDFLDQDSEINKTVNSLFYMALLTDEDEKIFNQAHKRILKGNPPGKNGSIGDAIVWEILLKHYKEETVYIISEDGDWYDEIDNTQLKQFLLKEWKVKGSGKIQIFRHLGEFLKEVAKVSITKQAIEQEKRLPPMNLFAPKEYTLPQSAAVYTSNPFEQLLNPGLNLEGLELLNYDHLSFDPGLQPGVNVYDKPK